MGMLVLVPKWKTIAGPGIVNNFVDVDIDIHIAGDTAETDIDALEWG